MIMTPTIRQELDKMYFEFQDAITDFINHEISGHVAIRRIRVFNRMMNTVLDDYILDEQDFSLYEYWADLSCEKIFWIENKMKQQEK